MPLSDFLSPDSVVPSVKAHSKKQALQELAAKAAEICGLPEREIFETLLGEAPAYAMDPFEHPPEVCRYFEEVRASLATKGPFAEISRNLSSGMLR